MDSVENERSESLITLTLDMGASISKGLYNLSTPEKNNLQTEISTTNHYMYMESEMITISEKMIGLLDFENSVNSPENFAWIKLKSKDSNVTAFGLLAKKFKAMKQTHEVKYENALDKTLAFIGAIIRKHNLNPLKIEVALNLLIPYDEYTSRENIQKNIQKNIQNYYFQDTLIQSRLITFNCYPEGFGGFINRASSKNQSWLKEKKIAVLMIGHRNCTCLIFDRGSLFHGETISTGFFDLIKDIKSNSIGQNLDDLEFIIPKYFEDLEQTENILFSLVKAHKKQNQKMELQKIKSAIHNSKQKLWNIISIWLDGQVPNYLHEIMILGGAAQYFQKELKDCFSWGNIDWSTDIAKEINELFFSEFEREDKLSFRFIDVFGLHKFLTKDN